MVNLNYIVLYPLLYIDANAATKCFLYVQIDLSPIS